MNEEKQYIEGICDYLEYKIKRTKKVKGRIDLLTSLPAIFSAISGAFCIFGGLSTVGLFAGIIAVEFKILNYLNKKFYKKRISILEKEKKHIEKVSNSEIESTNELNQKRIDKINDLSDKKDQLEECRKRNRITGAIAAGVSSLATGVSAIFLPVLPVALIGGSITAGIINIAVAKLHKKTSQIDLLSTRANNISNDLNIIASRNQQARAERRKKAAEKSSQVKGKAKTYQNNIFDLPETTYTDVPVEDNSKPKYYSKY